MTMKKRRPLGLQQTFWLAIGLTVTSIILGAVALYRYQLYRGCRDALDQRVKAIAETYAAQVAPLLLTGSRAEASSLVENVAWHPESSLIAILNPRNQTLAIRGDALLLERCLKQPEADIPGKGTTAWRVPGEPDRRLPELSLAAAAICVQNSPERLGTLVYAARLSGAASVPAEEMWKFVAYLVLIAATGMVLGFLWLKQKVLKPLADLARESKRRATGKAGSPFLTHRRDEIGDLARALADMRLDLDQWQGRATRLQRSVDDRVADQTRKITRELRQAEKKIWTDPLTRLGNRRLFDDKFEEIFRAQEQAGQDLSIVMVDIDYFKTFNDSLGHKAGDGLLTFVGELLKQCLREQDLAIRYGGDEFLLILPAVAARDARTITERLIRMFAQQAKVFTVTPKPTMSAGIASLQEHQPATPAALHELADQALYDAKNAGKSQVSISRPRRQAALRR